MVRLISHTLVLLTMAIIPAAVSAVWHPNRPSWQTDQLKDDEVTLATVRSWTEPVLWLDARSAEAYEAGHEPGALLLNEDDWDDLIEPVLMAWQPGTPEKPGTRVVVYCDSRTCDASREVAERLRDETGWDHIYVLHDGWAALTREPK